MATLTDVTWLDRVDGRATRAARRSTTSHRWTPALWALVWISPFITGCVTATDVVAPTAAAMESTRPVAAAIQMNDPAASAEIEGYASAVSVNRGGDIKFYVNTKESDYTLQVLRIGWYGGRGMKKMTPVIARHSVVQPAPVTDSNTGLIECEWLDPYLLHVPRTPDATDWPSGIYVAKLTAANSAKQSYIVFVVRDDERSSDLLFQQSVTTYQAYNDWGGKSLYTKPRASKVSFNRPYLHGHGTGHLLYWELSMVRFLEKEGYDVSYTTDIDTHERGQLLLQHKGFLSVGHDEYWTSQMRDNVEAARDHGINLGFFGSNVSYWQIRLEPSSITGDPDRTIICYKNEGADPNSRSSDASVRKQTTVKFRSSPVDRPEDALVGVMYESDPVQSDIVISDEANWIFEGTGLKNGDHLADMLGYEVDRQFDHAPKGTQRIAHSPYPFRGGVRFSDMTVYKAASGSTVVATGSMQWNWGLQDPELQGKTYENAAVKIATRNILRRFGANPSAPATPEATQ